MDLAWFLKTYFPQAFPWPWSKDHLKVIERLQACILNGGLFALAMPRGNGKTTIALRAAIWALLHGHRRFATLVGATEKHAKDLLLGVKKELQSNELLLKDFPEVCFPIHCLENVTRRAAGQLFQGVGTAIEWSAETVSFPMMPVELYEECGGPNAPILFGSVLRIASITGSIRGPNRTLQSGEVLRPDLVILDDPQTRESAESLVQSEARAKIINGDVLGLAGPGCKLAVAMPCTVIREGDLADTFLDRSKHPEWYGLKTKMMNRMPDNMKLWEDYAAIRSADMLNDGDGSAPTEFYRLRLAEMDLGAEPSWNERKFPGELTATQHAMNLMLRDPDAFWAEYQNEPRRPEEGETPVCGVDLIQHKLHGFAKSIVPNGAQWLTSFIDVQDHALYWAVAAWSQNFTGWILDYGAWPEQPTHYFSYHKIPRTLATRYPSCGREGAILAGLNELSTRLSEREWMRHDEVAMRIDRLLVDSGHEMELVFNFCRASKHSAMLMPGRGDGVDAGRKPMTEYDPTRGDRVGYNWIVPKPSRRSVRHLRYDTNFWKTFIHKHFAVALGDPGSISLYGNRAEEHKMFAEHLHGEYPTKTFGNGRTVWKWKEYPNRDNHLLDCIVGCAASASMLGAVPGVAPVKKEQAPAKSKWSDVWAAKRAARKAG